MPAIPTWYARNWRREKGLVVSLRTVERAVAQLRVSWWPRRVRAVGVAAPIAAAFSYGSANIPVHSIVIGEGHFMPDHVHMVISILPEYGCETTATKRPTRRTVLPPAPSLGPRHGSACPCFTPRATPP